MSALSPILAGAANSALGRRFLSGGAAKPAPVVGKPTTEEAPKPATEAPKALAAPEERLRIEGPKPTAAKPPAAETAIPMGGGNQPGMRNTPINIDARVPPSGQVQVNAGNAGAGVRDPAVAAAIDKALSASPVAGPIAAGASPAQMVAPSPASLTSIDAAPRPPSVIPELDAKSIKPRATASVISPEIARAMKKAGITDLAEFLRMLKK